MVTGSMRAADAGQNTGQNTGQNAGPAATATARENEERQD
jgi:hypothetical protein